MAHIILDRDMLRSENYTNVIHVLIYLSKTSNYFVVNVSDTYFMFIFLYVILTGPKWDPNHRTIQQKAMQGVYGMK